jgi:hypothetical protein
MPENLVPLLIIYATSQALGTSTGAWGASRLLQQPGRWTHAVAGAGVGLLALVPTGLLLSWFAGKEVPIPSNRRWTFDAIRYAAFTFPSIGATIGLNLR